MMKIKNPGDQNRKYIEHDIGKFDKMHGRIHFQFGAKHLGLKRLFSERASVHNQEI